MIKKYFINYTIINMYLPKSKQMINNFKYYKYSLTLHYSTEPSISYSYPSLLLRNRVFHIPFPGVRAPWCSCSGGELPPRGNKCRSESGLVEIRGCNRTSGTYSPARFQCQRGGGGVLIDNLECLRCLLLLLIPLLP